MKEEERKTYFQKMPIIVKTYSDFLLEERVRKKNFKYSLSQSYRGNIYESHYSKI